MKTIKINNTDYQLIKNEKEVFNYEELVSIWTNYFDKFDYVLGDISYSKIRLKGFYDEKNPKVSEINNIKNMDGYLKDYCSFNCGYYLIKKS